MNRTLSLLITALLLLCSQANAGGYFADGLLAAKEEAKHREKIVLLLVWSQWNPISEYLYDSIWQHPLLRQEMTVTPVLTSLEWLESPTEEEEEATALLHGEKWHEQIGAHANVPAIHMFATDGTWLSVLQGEEFQALTTVEELAAELSSRVALAETWSKLLSEAQIAELSGNIEEEKEILLQLAELPFAFPENLLTRLKAVDETDESGWIARLEFQGWDLVKTSYDRAKEGDFYTVETELRNMLPNPAYTTEQRAQIEAAWGSALRAAEREAEAIDHFRNAVQLDPEGVTGKSCARLIELLQEN